ncbi:hypothetical protein D3C85_801940 [compost metagenome]
MVFARTVDESGRVDAAQVDLFPRHRQLARHFQAVFQVRVAQIPAEHGARQARAVAVPVQQVERWRLLALQVVRLHVIPHEVVRPQARKSAAQVAARHQAALGQGLLAQRHLRLVDKDVERARVAEIKESGQQGQAGGRILAARLEHGQRRRDDGAAHAKAEHIELVLARDFLRHLDGFDHALLDVIVPRQMLHAHVRIAPGHQEHGIALLHRIAHERIFRLQVKDIEFIDARRHHQQRPLVYCGRRRRVLDQLEQGVFKHHRARRGGHVAAHFESRLVGLRNAALLHVGQHIAQAFGQAFALGLDQGLLGVGIGGKKVGRRHGVDDLLHGKRNLLLLVRRRFHGIGHGAEKLRVQQVGGRIEGRQRAGVPGGRGEAAVFQFRRLAGHKVGPQTRQLGHVGVFQLLDRFRLDAGARILQNAGNRIALGLRYHVEPRLPLLRIADLRHPFLGHHLRIGHIHRYM